MGARTQEAVTFNSKQTDADKLRLLGILAAGADDETGTVDPAPTRQTLARLMDCPERTITNRINSLIESGELERVRMGSGPGNPSAFRILLEIPETTLLKGETKGERVKVKGEKGEAKGEELADRVAVIERELAEIKGLLLAILEKGEKGETKGEKIAIEKGEKGERVKAKGGKGETERVKALSFKSADDPTLDPDSDPKTPPNPPRGESRGDFYGDLLPRWDALAGLAQVFTAVSGIQPPHAGARYAAGKIRDRWLAPLAEIEDMANGSTEQLIRRAVEHMRQSGLTIADPYSIVNVSRSLLHNKNGPGSPAEAPALYQPDENGVY